MNEGKFLAHYSCDFSWTWGLAPSCWKVQSSPNMSLPYLRATGSTSFMHRSWSSVSLSKITKGDTCLELTPSQTPKLLRKFTFSSNTTFGIGCCTIYSPYSVIMWVIGSVNVEHFLVWKPNLHRVFFSERTGNVFWTFWPNKKVKVILRETCNNWRSYNYQSFLQVSARLIKLF